MKLCHCHIAWHTSEGKLTVPFTSNERILTIFQGFDLQLLERRDEMTDMYNATQLQSTCDAWDEYVEDSGLVQEDSGV